MDTAPVCAADKKGKAIHVFGEGEELRDHIYVEDVVSIIIQMLYRKSVILLTPLQEKYSRLGK